MVDLHRLRVFRAVIAEGSINGAAARLGYTPSAISQHVAALQRETGLTLVIKDGRGIAPTPAGLTLADEAQAVLAQLAELESVASDLREGRVGRLTLSYFGSAGAAWIPDVVAALVEEFPTLRLDLRLNEMPDFDPSRTDIDVSIVGLGNPPLTGFTTTPMCTDPYVAVVPSGHRLATVSQVDLPTLREELWVDNDVARGPCRQAIVDACATAGFTPCFQIEAHDYRTAAAFVARGIGITVMPQLGTIELPTGVRVIRIAEPAPRREIVLRVNDVVQAHPAVVRAVDLLRTAAHLSPPTDVSYGSRRASGRPLDQTG